jgi:hypothetical protein
MCWIASEGAKLLRSSQISRQFPVFKSKGRAVPSAGNEPVPCRPPPDPLQGRLFQRSGPERFLQIRVPALSTTRPMGFECLLTNELLSNLPDATLIHRRKFVGNTSVMTETTVNGLTAGLLSAIKLNGKESVKRHDNPEQ